MAKNRASDSKKLKRSDFELPQREKNLCYSKPLCAVGTTGATISIPVAILNRLGWKPGITRVTLELTPFNTILIDEDKPKKGEKA